MPISNNERQDETAKDVFCVDRVCSTVNQGDPVPFASRNNAVHALDQGSAETRWRCWRDRLLLFDNVIYHGWNHYLHA